MNVSENRSREFECLYEQHQSMVYKLSLKYSDYNEHLAEDATQHTFIQLYAALNNDVVIINMQTYLHTIVKNYTLNSTKKMKSMNLHEEIGECDDCEEILVQSAEETYVQTVEMYQSNTMVQMILDELKLKNNVWYKVVMEVFHKGRSQSEVAKELGMNDTAMYATVRRIRKWSNKHKTRFEESTSHVTKEVSDGHLFCYDDEFAHLSNKKCQRSSR